MLKGFKQFVMRGNVLDLAVAVVIGGAFGKIVAGLVADLLMPLVALVGGKPDFSAINFALHGTVFKLGDFLNEVVSFLMIAAAIYFFVVAPMNALNERRKRGEVPPSPSTKKCPECLTDVPIAARRCAACTSLLLN